MKGHIIVHVLLTKLLANYMRAYKIQSTESLMNFRFNAFIHERTSKKKKEKGMRGPKPEHE